MADNTIGELTVAITGDYSELQPAINAAAELAQTSGDQIASAFGSQVTPALEQAGAAAGSAGDQFHQLHLNLEEMASLAGFTVGLEKAVDLLKEFVSDAIDAASSVQFLTVALTSLTGSAEAANEVLETAANVASNTTASFLSLAQSGQQLAAFGIGADAIKTALEGIADWSEISGRSVESLTGALERVYLTGDASARVLRTLGLSLNDLADVMGISSDRVITAIKALGAESDVTMEIFAEAMVNKGQKSAQDLANTHEVVVNRLKTAWHEFASDVGSVILPALDKLYDALEHMMAGVAATAVILTEFAKNPIKAVTDGLNEYAKILGVTAAATTQSAESQADHTKKLQEAVQAALGAADAQAKLAENTKTLHDHTQNFATEIGRLVSEYQRLAGSDAAFAGQAAADSTILEKLQQEMTRLRDNMIAAGESGTFGFKQVQAALDDLNAKMIAAGVGTEKLNADIDRLSERTIDNFNKIAAGIAAAIDPVGGLTDAMVKLQDQVAKNQEQYDNLLQAFVNLTQMGILSGASWEEAFKKVEEAAKAAGVTVQQFISDLQVANSEFGQLPIISDQARQATDKLQQSMTQLGTHGRTAIDDINRAIERDLSKALTDVIFQTGKVSDAFKKLGEDVVDIVLNHIIKDALRPLLDMLDNVLSKLGLGSAGAAGGTALPGFAPGMAGSTGIGGVGGAVSGALGGALGAVGAIGAVGSFVTGVIGDFQTAHQTDVLRSIEYNTRVTAQWIGPHGGSGVGDWTWQTAVNTMGVTEFVGGGGWFHDSVVQQLDLLRDIDSQLKTIAKTPGGGGAIAGGIESSGNVVVNFGPININGAGNPQQTVQQIANYLRRVSNKFGPP